LDDVKVNSSNMTGQAQSEAVLPDAWERHRRYLDHHVVASELSALAGSMLLDAGDRLCLIALRESHYLLTDNRTGLGCLKAD
jgi:hypothetical protein